MGKVKVHRATPSLDMTPMVDLAFLLVTFFMLTTTFAPEEPVAVDIPKSESEIILPDKDRMIISVAADGRVFFDMDNKFNRVKMLEFMGERYGVEFTQDQKNAFAVISGFGIPVKNLPEFLDLDPDERKRIIQPGIPADSANNELADWVMNARLTNPSKLRIAIKGDRDSDYKIVKQVVETLIDRKILRFNLITGLEQES
ncbi:MAG TPA: biopolymer transporter ExbD [Chryseosolibacter sp.]|nr:biopolymer transporter ExbD [Chryseosolibacter sp.]